MLYKFKSKMINELNSKQEEYVKYKKEKYDFKNKNRVDTYKIAQAVDQAEADSVKRAVDFAGISDLMD